MDYTRLRVQTLNIRAVGGAQVPGDFDASWCSNKFGRPVINFIDAQEGLRVDGGTGFDLRGHEGEIPPFDVFVYGDVSRLGLGAPCTILSCDGGYEATFILYT